MDITGNRPAPSARRFEAGTPPVVNCYAAEAGLKMLLRVGTPAIEKRNHALTRRCMADWRRSAGRASRRADDARRGATVRVPSRDAARLSAELMKRDIVTSHRDDNVRASFHFYNNEDDVESFIAAMQEPARLVRPRQEPRQRGIDHDETGAHGGNSRIARRPRCAVCCRWASASISCSGP